MSPMRASGGASALYGAALIICSAERACSRSSVVDMVGLLERLSADVRSRDPGRSGLGRR